MKKLIGIIAISILAVACNSKVKEHEQKIADLQYSLDSIKLESEKAEALKQQSAEASNTAASAPEAPKKKKISNTAKGALIGAGVGAVTGAIVSKKKAKGAVIGGLIGAGAGAVAGSTTEKK